MKDFAFLLILVGLVMDMIGLAGYPCGRIYDYSGLCDASTMFIILGVIFMGIGWIVL